MSFNYRFLHLSLCVVVLVAISACKKDPVIFKEYISDPKDTTITDTVVVYDPEPYAIQFPYWFQAQPLIPQENPLTKDGVALGRRLFYDPVLSGDSTQSCASCHKQEFAFTDGLQFSQGIDGTFGTRNAMAIINMAYSTSFFWDGRAEILEDQALEPVPNLIEMHLSWEEAAKRLSKHPDYPTYFYKAFGSTEIDSNKVVMALAQFMRIIISSNAKIDDVLKTDPPDLSLLTESEFNGWVIYNSEEGDCFHCHGVPLMTDNHFHNNGLDETFSDLGRSIITSNPEDEGKFKAPTLRNIELTAPYMHDGRFQTLEEVLEHYNQGLHWSPTIDPLMKKIDQGGLLLEPEELQDLLNFLKSFTDESFTTNPEYSNPFE